MQAVVAAAMTVFLCKFTGFQLYFLSLICQKCGQTLQSSAFIILLKFIFARHYLFHFLLLSSLFLAALTQSVGSFFAAMKTDNLNILLADDDADDCIFFKDALDELSITASLSTVNSGVELMNFLENPAINLPHILFLDLNMPRKTGFDCLAEIKANEKLQQLPVIIYSTSFNPEVMDLLYNNGAHYYIRKPADFKNLKSVLHKALSISRETIHARPSKEKFVIQP